MLICSNEEVGFIIKPKYNGKPFPLSLAATFILAFRRFPKVIAYNLASYPLDAIILAKYNHQLLLTNLASVSQDGRISMTPTSASLKR